MAELNQQAFDRISELAQNAIKERDVAREALKYARRFLNDKDHDTAFVDAALTFRAEGSER